MHCIYVLAAIGGYLFLCTAAKLGWGSAAVEVAGAVAARQGFTAATVPASKYIRDSFCLSFSSFLCWLDFLHILSQGNKNGSVNGKVGDISTVLQANGVSQGDVAKGECKIYKIRHCAPTRERASNATARSCLDLITLAKTCTTLRTHLKNRHKAIRICSVKSRWWVGFLRTSTRFSFPQLN